MNDPLIITFFFLLLLLVGSLLLVINKRGKRGEAAIFVLFLLGLQALLLFSCHNLLLKLAEENYTDIYAKIEP